MLDFFESKTSDMVSHIQVNSNSDNSLVPVSSKPLPEPMLIYCESGPKAHISMKLYFKFKSIHWRKLIIFLEMQSTKSQPFCVSPIC